MFCVRNHNAGAGRWGLVANIAKTADLVFTNSRSYLVFPLGWLACFESAESAWLWNVSSVRTRLLRLVFAFHFPCVFEIEKQIVLI